MSLKRKAGADTDFFPAQRWVNYQKFHRAVEEFERYKSNEKKSLFATDVHLKKWLNSGINEKLGNMFVEAIFKNGYAFTDNTVADFWIVKVQNPPHEVAVNEIAVLFVLFRELRGYRNLLKIGGGNMIIPGCILRPDNTVRPRLIQLC